MAAEHVDGTGDVALGPFVVLADVDEQRRLAGREQVARLRGVDLFDLRLDLTEQLAVARHDFHKYSGVAVA